jgi:hypothetical protein
LAACREKRSSASNAPHSLDSLLAVLALDTTIIESKHGAPSDIALGALLTRLGFPRDEKHESPGSGCELRGFQKKSDTLSSLSRVHCHMRGDDADVDLDAVVSPEGYAERLYVREPDTYSIREPLQTIELDLTEPFKPGELNLYTEDFDGDGVRELLVRNFEGATGNFGYEAWRFEPTSRRFTKDTVISKMGSPVHMAGRPCVRESWNSSIHDQSGWVECFSGGRWVIVWHSETHSDEKSMVVRRSLSVRIGDSLRVVRSDTLRT